ncbi:MAG: DUF3427 domain-containing protein [Oscillospiraceae bacterium]|nr:DUF3427 domain-containing protein [Oscillospiraceae bacterium]
MNVAEQLLDGIKYGFLDSSVNAEDHYKPALLVNDYKQGEKVLTSIEYELKHCDEFFFSVAFVTEGGVTSLIQTFNLLKEKGISGKIVASQYQNFTQPKALRKLLSFNNIELRIVSDENCMHTKGYIFRRGNEFTSIIGSSNLTQNALCENKEWNIKVVSTKDAGITFETLNEFNKLFELAVPVDDDFLNSYQRVYNQQLYWSKKSEKQYRDSIVDIENKIKPNKMQVAALNNIDHLRKCGAKKALLISATGTGKTYLAAMDVCAFNPGRCLFLIHREQIAKAALKSFKRVIGSSKTMSIFSGNNKDKDSDFLFATTNMMSKDDVLKSFKPDEFDYIVFDEAHRTGAPTSKKILDYFNPKFLLGMTATPERTDGVNIYELFDYNIAYEIRLQDAMEEKLICPFHYFGISDIEVNGELISDDDFNSLVSDERVKHILEKSELYGYSGDRVKGLIFCSRNDICKELSRKFNELGFRTVALSGSDSQEYRAEAVRRLEQNEGDDCLDYIFTVDIFNEGVDIPSINQVIMLRPTESAIIFVQQLGRGLRQNMDKEYLVVIDFIGNYKKNFLIPIALSGDKTYNKDTLRKYISEGNSIIPGCSTVNFDEITAKRIFESIDVTDFNEMKLLVDGYKQLKNKLGRIPKLIEFDLYGEIDPIKIINKKFQKRCSYYEFLKAKENDFEVDLNDLQREMLQYISVKLSEGKRPHELIVLLLVLKGETDNLISKTKCILKEKYDVDFSPYTTKSIVNNMTNEFAAGTGKDTYINSIFIEPDKDDYKVSKSFYEELKNNEFKGFIKDVVDFGISRYETRYHGSYGNTSLKLYEKYTYEDVCRLLEWERNEVPTNIGGYKYNETTKTYPVFINYDKDETIHASIMYGDHFISQNTLIAISKSKRTKNSKDVQTALNSDQLGIAMHLFVRKNKDDKNSKEFYYLGPIHPTGYAKQFIMKDTNASAVELEYKLERPVRKDLYDYITLDSI